MRRIFLQLLIGSLCLTALIAIVALVGGNFGDADGRIVSRSGPTGMATTRR